MRHWGRRFLAAGAVLCGLVPRVAEAGGNPWADLDRYKTGKLTLFADTAAVEAFRTRAEAATAAWIRQPGNARRPFPDQYPPGSAQLDGWPMGCGAQSLVVAGDMAYALHGDVLTTVDITGVPRAVGQVALSVVSGAAASVGPSYFPSAGYFHLSVEDGLVIVEGGASGGDRAFLVFRRAGGRLSLQHRFVVRGSGTFAGGKFVLYQPSLLPFGASHAGAAGPLEQLAAPRRSYRPLNETRGAVLHQVSVCEPLTGNCDTTVIAAPSGSAPMVLGDALYLWVRPWLLQGEKARSATLYRVPLDGGAVAALYVGMEAYGLALDAAGRVNVLGKEAGTFALYRILPQLLGAGVAEKPVLEFLKAQPRPQAVQVTQPYVAKNWFNVTFADQYVYYGAAYDRYIDPAHPHAPPPQTPDGDSVSTLFVQSLNGGATRRLIFDHFNYRLLKDGGSFGAYQIWPLGADALVVRDAYVQLVSHDQAENARTFQFALDAGQVCSAASSSGDAGGVVGLALQERTTGRARALFLKRVDDGVHIVGSGPMARVASASESNSRLVFARGRWLFLAGDDLIEAVEVNGQVRERSRLSL